MQSLPCVSAGIRENLYSFINCKSLFVYKLNVLKCFSSLTRSLTCFEAQTAIDFVLCALEDENYGSKGAELDELILI
jgi:hypothetical protein